MKAQPDSDLCAAQRAHSRADRRKRMTSFTVLVALLCLGATSCTKTQVALSSAAIAAVVVGTAVGVTYAVKHHNHTLQGCVFSDADGLKLRAGDAKVYTLKGDAASIKPGDNVKVHGSRAKKAKGGATGDPVFVVQKLKKDYGPCSAKFATSPAPTQ